MVKIWAEKEMRNLKRLSAAHIPCPEAILLKSHVLVMRFLGKDGWCAPRLKDANLKQEVGILLTIYHIPYHINDHLRVLAYTHKYTYMAILVIYI
jgi:serine/threonine-protein kinase RIO1